MAFLRNPSNGEIVIADDPTGALQQGFRIASDDEVDAFTRELYGSTSQQLQAQGERVVRGATFGAVEGFGEPEDIRARAEVSEELSPVTSFAATLVPDFAVAAVTGGLGGLATGAGRAAAGTALRSGAGLARAGLAAGRAGGAAALAGESLGTGLVTAGQAAYAEERSAVDDPGKFAEDVLFWGGLNFGLGKLLSSRAKSSKSLTATKAVDDASEELDEIAQAAEYEAAGKVPEGVPDVAATAPGGSIEDLSRQFNEITGLTPGRAAGGAAALGAAGALGANDQTEGAAGASVIGLGLLFPKFSLNKSKAFQTFVDDLGSFEKATPALMKDLRSGTDHLVGRGEMTAAEATEILSTVQRAVDDPSLIQKEAERIYGADEAHAFAAEASDSVPFSTQPPPVKAGPSTKAEAEKSLLLGRQSRLPESGPEREAAVEQLRATVDRLPEAPEFQPHDPDVLMELSTRIESAVSSLPEAELKAIRKFTGGGFDELRFAERFPENVPPSLGEIVPRLNEAIDKIMIVEPTKHGQLHRGMALPEDAVDELMNVDELYTHSATSTSYDQSIAKAFASGGGSAKYPVFFHFSKVDFGAPVLNTRASAMGGEAEVIIPRGSKFRITGRYQDFTNKRLRLHVTLEQVANSSKDDIMQMGALAVIAGVGGAATDETDGAAAAGLGGLGLLLGKRFGKAFARRAATDAAEDGMARALRNAAKTNADDIVARATRGADDEADSLGRQRRLYMNRGPILEVATREMQQDLTEVAKDVQQVTRADKLSAVSAHVSDNITAQKGAARVISEDAAKFSGELRGEARAYAAASGKNGLQYAVTGERKWTLALLDHAKEVEQATTSKALFEALDGFRRASEDFKISLEGVDSIHHQKLLPRVDAFARQIRSTLEDAGTWGRAGDMQRAYNAVLTDRLIPSMRVFEDAVLKRTHRGADGLWATEGWETKIAGLLRDKDPGARRHVSAVLDGMDELASVRRQFGDAKTAARIEERTAKVRRTMGLADEVNDASERMQALGDVIGSVPLGGMIRGFVTGDVFAAYQRLAGASEEAMARGVDDWIRSSRLRGAGIKLPKVIESDEGKQLAELAKRRGLSQTMVLFAGEDDSPGAAFERWRDALLDDEAFFEELGADYDTLQRSDPDAFLMLSGRASLARQFLIQRMPPNVAVSMAQPNGYPPSRDAVEDWAEYVVAVRHPDRVIANVGAMTQPQVEVLRTVYPRRHEQLQQRIIEAIATANDLGEPLDDSFVVRAGLLFPDIDGVGSPVFSREYGAAVREYNQGQQQAEGQRGGEPRKTPTNPLSATIQGGATFGQGF